VDKNAEHPAPGGTTLFIYIHLKFIIDGFFISVRAKFTASEETETIYLGIKRNELTVNFVNSKKKQIIVAKFKLVYFSSLRSLDLKKNYEICSFSLDTRVSG